MTKTNLRAIIAGLALTAFILSPIGSAQAATITRIQYVKGKPVTTRTVTTKITTPAPVPVKATPVKVKTPTQVKNTPVKSTPAPVKTVKAPVVRAATPVRTAAIIIPIKGDVTQDGKITQEDVNLIANISIGVATPDIARGDMDGDGQILNNDIVLVSNIVKASQVKKGDTNKNGVIDQTDLVQMTYMAAGLITPDLALADMDGDGKVMVNDVVLADKQFKGDINQDGVIDRTDLTALLYMSADLTPANLTLGDIDGDGKIMVNDVVLLQQKFKGDLNQDGYLTQDDITLMSRMTIGVIPQNIDLGDIDGDGQILANDMVLLNRLVNMKRLK